MTPRRGSYQRRRSAEADTLSEAWERGAARFTAWARAPMHDSYWRFHRNLFLEIVPAPGRLTLDSPFVISGSYLEPFRYTDELERDGLSASFTSDHRPLETYVEALAAGGFVLERLREPAVPEDSISRPRQRRWQRLPLFLHLRAIRT